MSPTIVGTMGESLDDSSADVVADAARALYAVPLAEFVASRKQLAATAKTEAGAAAAKEILALRKPTLTAWAMNLVPRADASPLADVVGLGARMRAAQSQLDTATLTSVRGERDAALTAYIAAVVTGAEGEGAALSPSARDEVRASAIAALADESASQALASGQLTRALSYSGFGEVDLSGAVGVTSSGSIMSVLKGGLPQSGEEPGAGVTDAVATPHDDDELTPEELAEAVAAAKAAKARAKARIRAEAEVSAAESQMATAQSELDEAETAARAARKDVIAAQKRLDAARAELASSNIP